MFKNLLPTSTYEFKNSRLGRKTPNKKQTNLYSHTKLKKYKCIVMMTIKYSTFIVKSMALGSAEQT